MIRLVAIVGGDPCTPDEAAFAEALGARLVSAGLGIVTGGRAGVMEAASRGAQRAEGLAVGILPGSDPASGNPFLTIAIPTGMGELRNGLVVAAAEAVIAVGGEYGTLAEVALAMKASKPVFGWSTWRLDRDPLPERSIIAVASVEDAFDKVERALKLGEYR